MKRNLLRVLVWGFALVGVVSLGLDWRKGNLGFFRWNYRDEGFSISTDSGLFFRDATVEMLPQNAVSNLGDYRIYKAEMRWIFLNTHDTPITIVFPPQDFLWQMGSSYMSVALPPEMAPAGPVIIPPRGEKEYRFSLERMYHRSHLPEKAGFHLAVNVDGKLKIFSYPSAPITYK